MRRDPSDGAWRVFRGGRWLPDTGVTTSVTAVAATKNGAWAATATGMAFVFSEDISLADKAKWYARASIE